MALSARIAFILALSLSLLAAAQQPNAQEPSAPAMSYELHASDITAVPGQPAALAISIKPPGPIERALISITGLPECAHLNAGIDTGGGHWLLPPRQLDGLMLTLPMGMADTLPLYVQLFDGNARAPLSAISRFEIRIVAPSQMESAIGDVSLAECQALSASVQWPAPPRAVRKEAEDLIRQGNKRMREGDILGARELYQKAVELGGPEAVLAMGRSYDPVYFARIDKKNAEPDPVKALEWYKKARDPGLVYSDPPPSKRNRYYGRIDAD